MSDATRSLVDESEVCVARARVVVREGPDAGNAITASGLEVSIGTAAGNDLVLTDPTVSRHHLAIDLSEKGAHARDLGSTNGTRFASRRVGDVWLTPGDRLQLGNTVIELAEPRGLLREPISKADAFEDVLGTSRAMRQLFATLPRVASSDSTVLLTGETGCGKSLIADAIHRHSPRAGKPFIVIDCGAIPASLIESELFGHPRGAFTGADRARLGAFRAADGGTLFLEEIGELPIELQPKLLRAIESRRISPVGEDIDIDVDIRIIAATNRDLRARVNEGNFRADLFFRLNVIKLRVPPLRDRREDIAVLASHFHREMTGGTEAPAELIRALGARDWPGNVRELRTAIERAIVLGELVEETAPRTSLPNAAAHDFSSSFRAAKEGAVADWERSYLTALIARHDGNVSAAARAVRMDRNHLRELLRKRGVEYK